MVDYDYVRLWPMKLFKKPQSAILFVYNDGGRSEFGYKGETGDCVCRAIAIASGLPYIEIYKGLNSLGKMERTGKRKKSVSKANSGVYTSTNGFKRYMKSLGFEWVPCMGIGTGCKVHLKKDELPKEGRLIVALSKHLAAVIDGVLHDTHDCSRDGTRCVYGYWILQKES